MVKLALVHASARYKTSNNKEKQTKGSDKRGVFFKESILLIERVLGICIHPLDECVANDDGNDVEVEPVVKPYMQ